MNEQELKELIEEIKNSDMPRNSKEILIGMVEKQKEKESKDE